MKRRGIGFTASTPIRVRSTGDITHTLIDWDQRLALRGRYWARWLQLYTASHAKPYPVKVATLRDLSGSRAKALKHFSEQTPERARRFWWTMTTSSDGEIEMPQDLLYVERGRAISSSQKWHLDRIRTRT